jgi:hypothetical protein
MTLKLKVKQVISLGQNMVRVILTRPGLRSRVEVIPKTQEQKMAQDLAKQAQQVFGNIFPGGMVIGGPMGGQSHGDLTVDMMITDDEYTQMGRPGINDIVQIDITKITDE